MNIAVFGGTFDPPHYGHLLVARQVLEEKPAINQIWLLPANTNPDKRVFATVEDRMTMTRFLEEPGIVVSELDIQRGGETYTLDTIRTLLRDKKDSYYWLMGSDLISALPKWQGYKEIIQSIPFIIFPRPDYPMTKSPHSFELLPENRLLTANYSSTVIRQRVAQGKSVKGLVPDRVADYIGERKLYRQETVYV